MAAFTQSNQQDREGKSACKIAQRDLGAWVAYNDGKETMSGRPATGSMTSKGHQKRRADYRPLPVQLAWNDPQPDGLWDRRIYVSW
jgi:hypothetical protein